MTETIVIEFYHLFLSAGQHLTNQDEPKWYSIIDIDLYDRNSAVICFETASCWDSETNQHYFISLPNGVKCKSDLRIVSKANLNVTSSKSFETKLCLNFNIIFFHFKFAAIIIFHQRCILMPIKMHWLYTYRTRYMIVGDNLRCLRLIWGLFYMQIAI